ncbi:endolytic transglycosylase MltG [Serinicoccus kebangsaanensis]|uniref:endolytic transglycosylase MltG n=1 Tax=Serinicoccus kebangsaanensis TaxID=2602069 RepID=UPI00124C224B|nr:endolytic transglycosylase MltG [Serinicoccus kebangsaanensis]
MSQPPPDDWDEHDRHAAERFDDDVLGLRGERHHDEWLADHVMATDELEEETFRPRRRRQGSPVLRGLALAVAAVVVVVASVFAFGSVRSMLPDLSGGEQVDTTDYAGEGSGEVMVEIPDGAAGAQIAEILAEEDVVGSVAAFTTALQANPDAAAIQPGTYRMANQMSSEAALSRLLDSQFREFSGVTVREGLWVAETFEVLAEGTDHEVADYEAVDPASLDLPEAAQGELEGFLFPSTYEFGPESTPEQQLQTMIDQGQQVYADIGIPDEDLREVVIKGSIVQGEGQFAEDLPKIARVMENRIEGNSETDGFLQMDSTVHFIFQERGRAGTTEEQRSDDSPYNTYVHPGLPPGPINSPGEDALRAAYEPEQGDWVYFVTVNPSTGETKFAETYEEHLVNQDEFLQWCEDNPDQC